MAAIVIHKCVPTHGNTNLFQDFACKFHCLALPTGRPGPAQSGRTTEFGYRPLTKREDSILTCLMYKTGPLSWSLAICHMTNQVGQLPVVRWVPHTLQFTGEKVSSSIWFIYKLQNCVTIRCPWDDREMIFTMGDDLDFQLFSSNLFVVSL